MEKNWSLEMGQLFDRLYFLIEHFAETHAAFDRKVGIANGHCNYWARRINQPRSLTLIKVCSALGVSANWLLRSEERRVGKEC